MVRKFLAAASMLALMAASSHAADLPKRVAVSTPAFAAASLSWTGFYVGANIGALSFKSSSFYDPENNYLGQTHDPAGEEVTERLRDRKTSPLPGLQAGFNLQSGSLVMGFEADFGLARARTLTVKEFCDYCSDVGTPGGYYYLLSQATRSQIDSFGTLRGRLGLSLDRTMVYVTAGLAFGQVKDAFNVRGNDDSGDPDGTFARSSSGWRFGWTAGLGAEHAIANNVSVKLEGLYYDLGDTSLSIVDYSGVFNHSAFSHSVTHSGFLARAGLNYRIGGVATPVVARY